EKSQVYDTGRVGWSGPDDASVTVRLLYDESHLYVFARFRDQDPLAPRTGETWESGDVLELFFDTDRKDDLAGEVSFNEDDLQLMLVPHGMERAWAAIASHPLDPKVADKPKAEDRGLTGIRVARRQVVDELLMEVAIPLHNLPGLRPGTRQIGFNIAFGDRDDEGKIYNYLILTGGLPPVDRTGSLARLEFDGPPVLVSSQEGGGHFAEDLGDWILYLLPIGSVLGFLLLARRAFTGPLSRRPRLRRVVGVGSGLLLLLVLSMPALYLALRRSALLNDAGRIAREVENVLPAMEEAGLARLKEAGRDMPLIDLLSGRVLRLPVHYRYLSLAEASPSLMEYEPTWFPEQNFGIYHYGAPITGSALHAELAGAKRGDELILVVSNLTDPTAIDAQGPGRSDPARVRVVLETAAGEHPIEIQIQKALDSWNGAADRAAFWEQILLEEGVSRLRIKSLGCPDLRLEGLSLRSNGGDARGWPQFLSSVSRLGVPTKLHGPFPRDAGHLIPAGKTRKLELPRPVEQVEKIWFFLEGVDGAGFRETPDAAVVGQVLVQSGEPGTKIYSLRHQVEIFAGRKDKNPELQRMGQSGHAGIAYEWQGQEGERRILPGFSLGFRPRQDLSGLVLSNRGSYDFRLKAVVLAIPLQFEHRATESSPLVATGRFGEVRLDPAIHSRLSRGSFFLFRNGELSSGSPKRAEPNLNLAEEVEGELRENGIAFGRGQLLPDSFEAFMPLTSEGWGDAVLGVALQDPDWGGLSNLLHVLSMILASLVLPWFLVYLVEQVAPAGSLRLQLTGTVALGAIVPLLVLSVFLVNLMEKDQREEQRRGLLAQLSLVASRLEEAKRSLEEESRVLLRQFVDEVDVAGVQESERIEVLREALSLARPKAWAEDSFLTLDLPHPRADGRIQRIFDRPASRKLGQTALGPGAGLYSAWGKPFLAARADLEREEGPGFRLSIGRVLDGDWLGSLVASGHVALYDLHGYPIAAGTGQEQSEFVGSQTRVDEMTHKASIIKRLEESQGPVFTTRDGGQAAWLGAFTLLRDRGGKPLALLGCLDSPAEATLLLSFGELGVRPFFIIIVGLLLVFVTFLAWMVTDRISCPIERLEKVACSLSRGELDVRVDPVPGSDEIANLSRAFGNMAIQLKERIQQSDRMNSAMARLTSKLELELVAEEAITILREASGAREVLLLLWNHENGLVRVFREGEPVKELAPQEDLLALIGQARGAFSVRSLAAEEASLLPAAAGYRSVFPLRVQDRRWGAVLTDFGESSSFDFEHFQGLIAQVVSAMESARLYGAAIEDPTTGLVVRRYFRRRLAQEVDRSKRLGDTMSLLRIEVKSAGKLRESWGDAWFDHVLGRLGEVLRTELPTPGLAGRVGLASFEVLLPGTLRADCRRAGLRLKSLFSGVLEDLGKLERSAIGIHLAAVTFPEDGGSPEFLLDALARHMLDPAPAESQRDPQPLLRKGAVFGAQKMQDLLTTVDRAAGSELALLIEGETGVGKEVIVDLCHAQSRRASGPLVKVNCTAIPAALLESELFGHEKGAFTGATERKRGFFEQADGGTLFLDEIGEMPVELQGRLLRVLQEKELERVGGEATIQVDVRVVAATQGD
ncbi:MAG: sigma 54-interacting transcriptional regulator, partial [Planctomycetota bacterium]